MFVRSFIALGIVGIALAGCSGGGTPGDSQLVRTWIIKKISLGANSITCPGSDTLEISSEEVEACPPATAFTTFRGDGTLVGDTGSPEKGTYSGTWSLSGNQLSTSYTYTDGESASEVTTLVSVSDSELIVRDSDGVTTTLERRAD